MKLYHYTTIDKLALILKNKTIRFNRLDRVDDIEEGAISPAGVRMGQYTFVSCWTKDDEESIPLWKMYTANGKGVRIGLEYDMFKTYDNSAVLQCGAITFNMKGTAWERTFTPLEDMVNSKYMVIPVGEKELNHILKDIQYVDNVAEAISSSVFFKQITPTYETVTFSTRTLGAYKNKRWKFEEETRYVLLILPGRVFKQVKSFNTDFSQCIYEALKNNLPNSITHYDLHLKEDVFESLDIVLGPMCSKGEQIIVEALCAKYAPDARINLSCLQGNLRF